MTGSERVVWVPFERLAPWRARYDANHPGSAWTLDAPEGTAHGACLVVRSPDRSTARLELPFGTPAEPTFEGVVADLGVPRAAGVLLVRRGGYAIARLDGPRVSASKVGQRHVQGRTKAGGWSQQRFARRRANQAQVAFDAAAQHAVEILGVAGRLAVLGLGGDRPGVAQVLQHPELARVAASPQTWLESSGDPNRAALDHAITRLRSLRVTIVDP